MVFNASAALTGEKSLNDVLDPGPSLMPNLTGMLMRFREYEVGFQADIKKAFFMIGVRKEDRPYLRFVWPDETGELVVWRLTKLPFGVTCSPFILTAVLQHHLRRMRDSANGEEASLLKAMPQCFYVDDCVSSASSLESAHRFKDLATHTLSKAGMELHKWCMSGDESQPASKVLGVNWCTVTDQLSIAAPSFHEVPQSWTKRALLQYTASVFDPFGLAAPLLLIGKMLLQEAWKSDVGWDDPLPNSLGKSVAAWWGGVMKATELKIPRWLHSGLDQPVVLHLFADASELAYGCVIYAVIAGHVSLVFSKTKVAPLKLQTLARLELQAAFQGANCLKFVREQLRLPVVEVHAWSDSLTALYWIEGQPHRWKTWVGNRVANIQRVTKELHVSWHHCPGVMNPADLASRGASIEQVQEPKWLSGPTWLPHADHWPVSQQLKPTDESVVEVKLNVVTAKSTEAYDWWSDFSLWPRLKRIVKLILSWKHKDLSAVEMEARVERGLLCLIQQESFPLEYASLSTGAKVSQNSRLAQLQPFVGDDGLIRATTRLEHADVDESTKNPIILANHHVTKLMLFDVHIRRFHQGVEGCLSFLRRRFCIIGGRRLLRSIKGSCVTCRRFDAKPASEAAPPLPSDRVVYQRPFAVVGVDHAGPLIVKERGDHFKAWILLFVCATTRAVHLELVMSLSTEEFLRCYRRFVARYGQPSLVRSDNASVFVSASRQLGVEWKFNPPSAPWHGGFYERLVAVVKSPLRRVLGKSMVSRDEMATVLAEVEFIVNERPLTHVGGIDEALPLTPNMMIGRQSGTDVTVEASLSKDSANRRLQYLQQLQQNVASRWKEEYLLSLRQFCHQRSHCLEKGDIVLVVDTQKKRTDWKLAVITELFPGVDGKKRVARVRIGGVDFLRPIQRLVPLEMSTKEATDELKSSQPDVPSVQEPTPSDELSKSAAPAKKSSRSRKQLTATRRENRTRTRVVQPKERLDL